MSQLTAQDKRDMSQFLGRTWGILLTAGILTFGLGVVMLVWPEADGARGQLAARRLPRRRRVSRRSCSRSRASGPVGCAHCSPIGGILSLALGLFAFRSAAHSVAVLVLLIGIAWLMSGIGTLVTAISDPDLPGPGWAIFSGILGILGGLVILAWPGSRSARAHLVLRPLDDRGGPVRGLRVVQDALAGSEARGRLIASTGRRALHPTGRLGCDACPTG